MFGGSNDINAGSSGRNRPSSFWDGIDRVGNFVSGVRDDVNGIKLPTVQSEVTVNQKSIFMVIGGILLVFMLMGGRR